jgi:outer membrane protein assembly factor BamB
LYAGDSESLLAMAEEDGTVKWQVDFPVVNDIVQVGDKLCATTRRDLIVVDAKTGERVWDYHAANEFATVSNPVVVDGVVACVTSSTFVDEEIYSFEQNILHIFDPTDGTELQSFELGVGDCYGLSAENESIVCSAGGELICIENFPTPA